MGDTEATLRPIGTVLSLVCQQYRVVVPNCNCRSVRSAGGEYRTFTKCTVRGSLYPVETDSGRKFQYWYTYTAVPVERYTSYRYWNPVHRGSHLAGAPPCTAHPFFVLTLHNHTSIESARSQHYNGVWYVFSRAHSAPIWQHHCSQSIDCDRRVMNK